jgi:hypothetical protein
MGYIDKDNAIDIIDNSADLQEAKSCVSMMENADVIKRTDFDKVVQTYKLLVDLKELRVTHQEDIINDLHSKINGAIENIKQDMTTHSGTGEEVIQAYCDGLKKALEYLEIIGE